MGSLVGGAFLVLIGLFMLLGFFNLDRALSLPVAVTTFVIAVVVPLVSGGGLLFSQFRRWSGVTAARESLRLQTLQADIVKLAERKGGKVTVVEVVADTALDVPTAEAALSALVTVGVADVEITESGLLVYVFHDIQKLPEKGTSRRVFDA